MKSPIEINEKNASGLRKYFYEYTVLGLCFAVATLFYLYITLNLYIRETQQNVIQKNSEVLNNFIQTQNRYYYEKSLGKN
jgi:hypothetical protein